MRNPITGIYAPEGVVRARGWNPNARGPQGRMLSFLARSDGEQMKRPAVRGYAALFGTTFSVGGNLLYLQPGCCDDAMANGERRRLLIEHNEVNEAGATEAGLTFAADAVGLAFQMPLPSGMTGGMISSMVTGGNRATASLCFNLVEAEVIEVNGRDVHVASKINFSEVSLVADPAIKHTFAEIVDLDEVGADLAASLKSPLFPLAKLDANIKALNREVVRELRAAAYAPQPRRYTLDDSNRAQTDLTESLQRHARERLS